MSDRIARLEENLLTLTDIRRRGISDRTAEWALRYGLLETIQIVIDLSCRLVADRNLGSPVNYRQCVELLARHGLIEQDLSDSLTKMVGLRNLIVHEYDQIDIQRLISLSDRFDDIRAFAERYVQIVSGTSTAPEG